MHNFEELQRRCRRYRLKRWIAPLLVICGVIGFGAWWIQSEKIEKRVQPSPSVEAQKSASSQPEPEPKRRCFAIQLFYGYERFLDKLLEHKKRAEALGFVCHIKRGKILPNGNRQLFLVCDTSYTKRGLRPGLARVKCYKLDYQIVRDECRFVVQRSSSKRRQSSSSSVNRVAKASDSALHSINDEVKREFGLTDKKVVSKRKLTIPELEKLFEKRKSYAIAIRIARGYYAQGEYRKALKWAKRANKLDRAKEEAWILYAKSLYRLGKRHEAKKILRIFLEFKESKKAQELLREWR